MNSAKYIKNHRTQACQIERLKSCRTNCSRKIRSSISQMNQILPLQVMKTIENSYQYIELCKDSLQQLKTNN
ncbi:unnamed protein product (macronuclear) [Paramecium tetraurelia]|uniref:BHLH domain-containing protein n=1 Tax=Paramecium tetraurelia TaxID=5888 RepID=A0C1K9_PARTE|nr:uncharacterized protein GSPATT00034153001 [Paramecium tetraurelia]CAK64676.1 unnamed protein product [Paramecium tetraurelia]|eukprot:XP_001432073.1 hypothetical protein (macronuclear) [Paramecium tetraurelia strain d4-2]